MEGAVSLLTAMQAHGVDKIVFSSTAATYGEPEKQPIEEGDRTEPTNPYGATKLAIENMLKWCDGAYGIRYVALRYFNAAGSDTEAGIGEDHNPESHLIPLVMKTALGQRDHIGIFGEDYPTPDGTYYEVAATGVDYLTTAINTKGTWALNASGALGADIDVTEYTEDFIYIYSINKKTTTDDGLTGNSYIAYGVDSKGMKVSYTLATVDGTAANSVYISLWQRLAMCAASSASSL